VSRKGKIHFVGKKDRIKTKRKQNDHSLQKRKDITRGKEFSDVAPEGGGEKVPALLKRGRLTSCSKQGLLQRVGINKGKGKSKYLRAQHPKEKR